MSKPISSESSLFSHQETRELLDWFSRCGIDYPWGDNPTPYRVWISEIMLQQTVVTAAVGHFNRWMDLFPDVESLAAADEQSVLKAWEGLGYYSRARNLRKGAVYLMEQHGGNLPDEYRQLLKVPGIGDYTARALLSLAFGKPWPVLDANVRRIAQRLLARREWEKTDDLSLMESLETRIPEESPGLFNCALMQLGQQVCRVRTPDCESCPLKRSCRSRERELQGEIPAPKKRKISEKSSVLLLLISDGRILMTRREKGIGQGLWFLPAFPEGREEELSGELMHPEHGEAADSMILRERVHLYTSWKETLKPRIFFLKDHTDKIPEWMGPEGDRSRWIDLDTIDEYPTASVYRKILEDIPSLFLS
ncbi:MAG: NUDIX domain-containing protein [Spirochaetales bacterium]|nr:NUDIX domain-containing protein [Spirochaetales bacterium]